LTITTLFLAGCANGFKYFGNSYAPTQEAKIYFRESDIDQPYEIMGRLYASFKTNMSDTKVQRKIMTKVKQHGGDAAIFGEMGIRTTGSVSSTTGGSTKVGKVRVGTSGSTTKAIEKDQIEIVVIKYKAQKAE